MLLATFIITLVATGAGVFLALYFSNIEDRNKEKTNAVKILSASKAELDGKIAHVSDALQIITYINDSTYTFDDYINLYQIENGVNLRNAIDNDVVIGHLSPNGMYLLALWNDNVAYAFKQLTNSISKGKTPYTEGLITYGIHLETVRKMIVLEKMYIEEGVPAKDILDEYAEIEDYYREAFIALKNKQDNSLSQ